jgi:hypothetical protein
MFQRQDGLLRFKFYENNDTNSNKHNTIKKNKQK